jgi:endonuclease/exonuclease/phosphatase (EEP) superfamily protein YafD
MSTASTTPAPSPPKKRSLLQRLQEWGVIIALVATVAGWLGDLWWVFDLGNHFRIQYVLLLAVLLVTTLLSRRWVAAFFVVVGLTLNGIMVAPLFTPPVENVVLSADKPPLHVLSFNVYTGNQRVEEVVRYIGQSGADIVLVQEIDDRWAAGLRGGLDGYSLVFAMPRDDNFGIGLLVRRGAVAGDHAPLVMNLVRDLDVSDGVAQVPTIEFAGKWRGRPFALLGLHTLPPVREGTARDRDAQLAGAAIWANRHRKNGLPAIIIGDLNATPWCVPFRHMIADGNLVNSMDGRGMQGTFHARVPGVLRIPIDHCLHTRELQVLRRVVGDDGYGSDHLPVEAWIDWK